MIFDNNLFDELSGKARKSERLRMNFDLRNSAEDHSQRMLNAIEPGTELPIHRHKKSSETCIVLSGTAEEIFYDDQGNVFESVLMSPTAGCCGVNIPKGRWHKIISLEPGTVIFETKDGQYEPLTPEDILTL